MRTGGLSRHIRSYSGYLTAVPATALGRGAQGRRADEFRLFEQRASHPLGGTVWATTATTSASYSSAPSGGAAAAIVGGVGGGGYRVGSAVHHAGIEAIGHGEGLEVGLEGGRQRELVHQVDGCARHNGAAA